MGKCHLEYGHIGASLKAGEETPKWTGNLEDVGDAGAVLQETAGRVGGRAELVPERREPHEGI